MIGSRQLGRVLAEARKSGAKVVLVGDARQLQPIEAGAPFRAIVERIGFASIETIIRQREEWARKASMELAKGRVQTGLAAYQERGHVRFEASREEAKRAIALDWMAGRKDGQDAIVLAHTRADVRDLNVAIRKARAEAGELGEAAAFQTGQGKREFAAGDRIVFLKNDRELGVKNGTLGTVEAAEEGRLDRGPGRRQKASRERVTVEAHAYAEVDHGYAVTIHKSQGATVDRAFVLASGGMDRHLTYVAMTRHREQATLYAGRDDFENHKEMAWRLARKRTNETTLDFAERRGIDTLKDWIDNGRALLNRTQARFEQAAARIGERLGLGGRSLRQELQERQQAQQGPTAGERPQERPEKAAARQSPAGRSGASEGRERSAGRQGGKPPSRRRPRTCGPRPSASRPRPKSGGRRLPKSSMRSSGQRPPSPAVFPPYFLAPKRAMKNSWPNGRRSGTGWCERSTAHASARPRSMNSPQSPSPVTGAGARRSPSRRRHGGIPNLPRRSRPGRSSKSGNGRRRSARNSESSVSANAAGDAKGRKPTWWDSKGVEAAMHPLRFISGRFTRIATTVLPCTRADRNRPSSLTYSIGWRVHFRIA